MNNITNLHPIAYRDGLSADQRGNIPPAEFREQMRAWEAEAQATDCGVPGCDRTLHEALDRPSDWNHRVRHIDIPALGGGAHLYVHRTGRASIGFAVQNDLDLDATGTRVLAGQLESAARKLRELADEVDRRNA